MIFATEKRAYLDGGAADGLVEGMVVQLYRDGRGLTKCTVERLAAHQSSCLGAKMRVGDTFRLAARRVLARATPAAKPPQAFDDEATTDLHARLLAEAEQPRVDFSGRSSGDGRVGVALAPSYSGWFAEAGQGAALAEERIDAAVRLPLGMSGLRLDAAFSAVRWLPGPAAGRFRPADANQFYLWQAEISARGPQTRTVFAVGRIWPWHAPGLTVIDGFQVGRRSADQSREWGGYGGLVPTALSVAPSSDRWAGGVYGALTQTGEKSSVVRVMREEARLGVRRSPGIGLIGEAEALVQAWLGSFDLGTSGRVRLASGAGGAALENVQVDARVRPNRSQGAMLELRYMGIVAEEEAFLVGVAPALGGSYHATGAAWFDPLAWIGVGIYAGAHSDREASLNRADGTVELRLPRLLGDFGGLWIGAEAAKGWIESRGGYVQLLGHLGSRLRMLARGSATASRFDNQVQSASDAAEAGGFLRIDAAFSTWLRVGARTLVRIPLLIRGDRPASSTPALVLGLDGTGVF